MEGRKGGGRQAGLDILTFRRLDPYPTAMTQADPHAYFATTDLSDAHPELTIAQPVFRDFGGLERFYGPAVTLRVPNDNTLVRAALETPGAGRVLVVDGGGSTQCALVGGQLGKLAVKNGWNGIIVYGCVRDSAELGEEAVGIKALALHPRKSEKRGAGEQNVSVQFAGITINPGDWVYADADGVLVSPTALSLPEQQSL